VRRRSSLAALLGLAAVLVAWAFGSVPLAVIGLGLLLAALAARLWARRARDGAELERRILPGERIEGGDLEVEVCVRHARLLPGTSIDVHQRLGAVEQLEPARGSRVVLRFTGLRRGRHTLGPLEARLRDPLGLEQVEHSLQEEVDVLVRPRIPVLDSLFSSRGARGSGTARSAYRRPIGFEVHSVREYAAGEPLRLVHWPSTARRGRLMVKELADAPRDEVLVVLDQDESGVAGPPGASSFDAAVRAAGAVALAQIERGRRAVVMGTAPGFEPVSAQSRGREWEGVLDALAGVDPAPSARVALALGAGSGPASRAHEVVVVSGCPDRAAEALLGLRRRGKAVALVAVASETYAGTERARAAPSLLRLAAAGIPVAVVAADVPLEVALSGRLEAAAGA
jgi:uncharacterized protein (DUF58 family)